MELKQDVTHGTWDYPFQVHHTETSDGLYLYPHVHNEFEITCITKGQGIFYINNRKYSIKETYNKTESQMICKPVKPFKNFWMNQKIIQST